MKELSIEELKNQIKDLKEKNKKLKYDRNSYKNQTDFLSLNNIELTDYIMGYVDYRFRAIPCYEEKKSEEQDKNEFVNKNEPSENPFIDFLRDFDRDNETEEETKSEKNEDDFPENPIKDFLKGVVIDEEEKSLTTDEISILYDEFINEQEKKQTSEGD